MRGTVCRTVSLDICKTVLHSTASSVPVNMSVMSETRLNVVRHPRSDFAACMF